MGLANGDPGRSAGFDPHCAFPPMEIIIGTSWIYFGLPAYLISIAAASLDKAAVVSQQNQCSHLFTSPLASVQVHRNHSVQTNSAARPFLWLNFSSFGFSIG